MAAEVETDSLVFSPDSPLFGVNSNGAVNDILHLSDFLSSVVAKMKLLCSSLKHTAMTGNVLASQMQGAGIGGSLKNTGFVSPVIKHFGGILSGISSSQEMLAECLENAFITPLEAFNNSEISKIVALQQQYKREHTANEDSILRYLQGDLSNTFGISRNQAQLGIRALEVVQQRKKHELSRFDFVRGVNAVKAMTNFEIAEACISVLFALRSHHRESAERLQSSSAITNGMSEQQYEARTKYSSSLLPIEVLRLSISSVLDTMVERVETQLPSSSSYSSDGTEAPDQASTVGGDSLYLPSLGLSAADMNVAAAQAITRLGSLGASFIGGFAVSKPLLQSLNVGTIQFEHERKPSERMSVPVSSSSLSEVEMRMKALDRYQLEGFYAPHSALDYSGLIKEGYLLEKSSAKMLVQQTWSREWFVLDDTKLYTIKEKERGEKDSGTTLDVQVVCETMLASVRELKSSEVPFCFEISYANRSSHTLQAEGYREYEAWVGAIRLAIERRLIGATSTSLPFPSSSSASQTAVAHKKRLENAALVREVLDRNSFCVECERAGPDWVSLNLGCLMCIDCSGVHRSLGVHISKVRSLTLDDLDPEEYNLLKRIGNVAFNSIWEASVPPQCKKPRPHDSHAVRDRFIRAKYETGRFLAPRDQLTPLGVSPDECLRAACRTDDVTAALRAIAHGANVGCSKKRQELGRSSPSSSREQPGAPPPPPKMPPLSAGCSSGKAIPAVSAVLRVPSREADRPPAVADADMIPESDTLAPPDLLGGSELCSSALSEGLETVNGRAAGGSERGLSPLHLAVLSGSTACVVLLLMNGADPQSSYSEDNVSDNGGAILSLKSPAISLLDVAKGAGHELIVGYLQRKLDAMPAAKTSIIDSKPAVPVPSRDSPPDKQTAPAPSSSQPKIPVAVEPAAVKSLPPVPESRKSLSYKDRQQEEEDDDDLEDFYAALISEDPKPLPALKDP